MLSKVKRAFSANAPASELVALTVQLRFVKKLLPYPLTLPAIKKARRYLGLKAIKVESSSRFKRERRNTKQSSLVKMFLSNPKKALN
jgi:hypothetical protein